MSKFSKLFAILNLILIGTLLISPRFALAQVLDSAPSPAISALDDMNVDLKAGKVVRTVGTIAIGSAQSPVFSYGIFSTSFFMSGTPLYGITKLNCVTEADVSGCVYARQTWNANGDFITQSYTPPSTTTPAGFTDQGDMASGTTLTRKDGSIWQFGGPGDTGRGIGGSLSSITYPNGETLTYYYSGTQLRSVVSNTGYMLHIEGYSPITTTMPTKVVLINLDTDYCAPTAATCTGLTVNWPSVTYTGDWASTITATDNAGRAISRTTTTTTTGGNSWDVQYHYTTPESRWFEYKLNVTGGYTNSLGVICDPRSFLAWFKTNAGQWNYTWSGGEDCQFQGVTGGVSTGPDGVTQKWDGGYVDGLGRKTTYVERAINGFFGVVYLPGIATVTKPEANKFDFTYDNRQNLTQTVATAKAGGATLTASASFPATSTCTVATAKTCNQPTYTLDANGNETDYTYDPQHGGILTKTLPAGASTIRPQIRYTYQQLSAKYKTSAGGLPVAGPLFGNLLVRPLVKLWRVA